MALNWEMEALRRERAVKNVKFHIRNGQPTIESRLSIAKQDTAICYLSMILIHLPLSHLFCSCTTYHQRALAGVRSWSWRSQH